MGPHTRNLHKDGSEDEDLHKGCVLYRGGASHEDFAQGPVLARGWTLVQGSVGLWGVLGRARGRPVQVPPSRVRTSRRRRERRPGLPAVRRAVLVPTPACPQQTWPLSPPLHAALNRHGGAAFPNTSPAKHQHGTAGLTFPPRGRPRRFPIGYSAGRGGRAPHVVADGGGSSSERRPVPLRPPAAPGRTGTRGR